MAEMPWQTFKLACDKCGETGSVKLPHFGRTSCPRCGKQYWALQPKRNGPMVLYPWPGTWLETPRD